MEKGLGFHKCGHNSAIVGLDATIVNLAVSFVCDYFCHLSLYFDSLPLNGFFTEARLLDSMHRSVTKLPGKSFHLTCPWPRN